jgi:ribulose-5-phosphate 4-epimerase/fuculose-1-phosphate aldolase
VQVEGEGEAALRDKIAKCTRLLNMQEIIDFSGHVSARIPGTDHILIQPRDTSRAVLTADDLLVVDLEGRVLEGEGPAPSETALHTCVYRARPDAQAVCHGHPGTSTLFTVVDRPLAPVRNFAYRFADIPIHPDPTHIRSVAQGQAVAQTLAGHAACLLRGHGTVVVGGSVEAMFMDCLDIEENARSLIFASVLGSVQPLSGSEVEALRQSYGRSESRPTKIWEHYLHKGRLAGIL